jgi:mono/diheme cytochrome c family protein/thiol-disulfide isomerase/thioredoxin
MPRRLLPLLLVLAPAALHADESAVPIGAKVADLSFKDIHYLSRSLDDFPDAGVFVLVFTNTSCPVVRRYMPTLRRLDKDYRGRGVQFLAVNAGEDDTVTAMAAQAVQYEADFPFVKDAPGRWVRALGVRWTPEVVVLDAGRRLRYRGRIDDQYRPGATRAAPTRDDLKEALEAVLAGKDVAVPETPVDGCLITLSESHKTETPPTWTEQVGPIVCKHCMECHRPNTTAPFSLTDYDSARGKAKMIAEVVTEGRMPPWFAAPGGDFSNRRGLSDDEREAVVQWAASGAPHGKGDGPAPPDAPDKWLIGEPDLTLTTNVFELPADGDVPYKYAILSHVFLQETWVQGLQILPDNPAVVHHCNMAFAAVGDGFSERNFLTGFVPGGEPMKLDDGVACRIPAGSVLGLQIHFVTTGKAEKCRLSIGLRFPRAVVEKRLRFALLEDTRFAIPPGASAFPVTASEVLDEDAVGVGLFSHMHLRGKAMAFRAVPPDGDPRTLLTIPNYAFQWQLAYHYPPGKVRWTKGTRLECTALYDNSPFNSYNPDPKATVRHGPQTWQEMMNGFVFYVAADEQLNLNIDAKTGAVRGPDDGKK